MKSVLDQSTSEIKELNQSYISQESKRFEFEKKKQEVTQKQNWLKNESKSWDKLINSLVKEVNDQFIHKKQLNTSSNLSMANRSISGPKSSEPPGDFGNVNTQDTRMQTIDSLKGESEVMKKFFSTYSGRIEEVLLTHRKAAQEGEKLQTHRNKKEIKSIFGDSPSMFKDCSELNSERELNKNLISMDDSLSDVPVKDIDVEADENEDLQNLSIDGSDMILDQLGLLSPIMNNFEQEQDGMASGKITTPSFKKTHVRRPARKDLKSLKVKSGLNFDDSGFHIPMLELGNIPEVLDDSYMFSETTYKREQKNSNSAYTSPVREESKNAKSSSFKNSS